MNFLHKLLNLDRAVVAQVNPLDHGATYKSSMQAARPQPVAPQNSKPTLRLNAGQVPTINLDGSYNNLLANGSSIARYSASGPSYYTPNEKQYPSGQPQYFGSKVSPSQGMLAVPYSLNSIPKPKALLPLRTL